MTLYRWAWRTRLPDRTGQTCRAIAFGRLNSVLLEFADGYRVVTDRRGLRRGLMAGKCEREMTAASRRLMEEANTRLNELPDEARSFFVRLNNDVCDLAERLQLPPRQTAAALAGLIGLLAMVEVEGDVNDNEGVDEFLAYADMAMQVGVARARIARGWTP